jgi:hypothetical protein
MPRESLVVLDNEAAVLGGRKKIKSVPVLTPMGRTLEPTKEEAVEWLSRGERKHLLKDPCYAKSSGSRWAEGHHPVAPTGVTENKEGYG